MQTFQVRKFHIFRNSVLFLIHFFSSGKNNFHRKLLYVGNSGRAQLSNAPNQSFNGYLTREQSQKSSARFLMTLTVGYCYMNPDIFLNNAHRNVYYCSGLNASFCVSPAGRPKITVFIGKSPINLTQDFCGSDMGNLGAAGQHRSTSHGGLPEQFCYSSNVIIPSE